MSGLEHRRALTTNDHESEEHVAFACLVVAVVDGSCTNTSIKSLEKIGCNQIDVTIAVNYFEEAGFFVECGKRGCLLMISFQPSNDGFFSIISPSFF